MAKINLLPWRAERRKQRLKEFYGMLGLAAVIALLISILIVMYYNGQIEGQSQRNQYLKDQIAVIDTQITQIAELDKKKADLLKRKEVIEQLQASRSQMVHLFDELAQMGSEGIQITSLTQNGTELVLTGRAQSNARVSAYMRNFEASRFMTKPDVSVIEARGGNKGLPYEFSLKVAMKNPGEDTKAPQANAVVPTPAPAPAQGGTP